MKQLDYITSHKIRKHEHYWIVRIARETMLCCRCCVYLSAGLPVECEDKETPVNKITESVNVVQKEPIQSTNNAVYSKITHRITMFDSYMINSFIYKFWFTTAIAQNNCSTSVIVMSMSQYYCNVELLQQ